MTGGRTIAFGVSGGIAAYKAVQAVRSLVLAGHDVHVLPTRAALEFVGLPTWEAISRNPVRTRVDEDVAVVGHVDLGRRADVVVVAPATANTLARLASGMADDPLTTTALASTAPLVLAPAMHPAMWLHPATQANVALLRERGAVVVGPDDGPLTGDDSGPGRLADPERIARAAEEAASSSAAGAADPGTSRDPDLAGRTVVVTAGGTREPLDPVRFLGNRSSGRQGLAVAAAARARGARVVLIAAHLDVAPPPSGPGLEVRRVSTAEELARETLAAAEGADAVIMVAAVADFRPRAVSDAKIKKESTGERLTLELERNRDILAELVAAPRPGRLLVGFAAETAGSEEELLALGRAKLARKRTDLLVINRVGWSEGFGAETSAATLLDSRGEVVAARTGTKAEIADALLDALLRVGAAPSDGGRR